MAEGQALVTGKPAGGEGGDVTEALGCAQGDYMVYEVLPLPLAEWPVACEEGENEVGVARA